MGIKVIQYHPNLFGFWELEEDNELIYVFAGSSIIDPNQGVLIKYLINTKENQNYGIVYFTPVKDGPARIVDIVDGKVVITTISGVVYAFDVSTGRFFSLVNEEFLPVDFGDQLAPIPFKEGDIDILTNPTITTKITPLSSATANPTNPYP